MGKFRQCLTELSACDLIITGYYSLTFLFCLHNDNIIQPDYCTVQLGFFKMTRRKNIVKYPPDKDSIDKDQQLTS